MKKTLITLLTISCLNGYAQDSIPSRGRGLLPSTEQQQKAIPYSLGAGNLENLVFAASVDLSPNMPPVGDQGKQGSCVAWSVAYAFKSYQEAVKRKWKLVLPNGQLDSNKVFSPAFVFNFVMQHIKRTDECVDGMAFENAFDVMRAYGAATLKASPYNGSDVAGCLLPDPNNTVLLQNSSSFKFSNYEGVPFKEEKFKYYLSKKIPIMVGISLDDSFKDAGWAAGKNHTKFVWRPSSFAPSTGLHAVICVGYNDTTKELKLMNSWSSGWGTDGYFYVPYNVFFKNNNIRPVLTHAFIAYDAGILPAQVLSVNNINHFGLVSATGNKFANWFKRGYYVDYNGLRMGVAYLNKTERKAVITFSDPKNGNKIIQSLVFNIGEKKLFFFKNYKVTFELADILPAGKDRLINPNAAFYNVIFEQVTSQPTSMQVQ